MELLFKYLEAIIDLQKMKFEGNLAKGLDYYTRLIIETLQLNNISVDSIVSGIAMMDLMRIFARDQIPATGPSIGIEKVFAFT
jgi:histidyl-tRNA synthetase